MADTPVASTTRNNTHDLKKLYKSVRFQQGRPVLDTELNDLQDISLEQVISEIRNSVRFSGLETSPFEWAVLPLGDEPNSVRNIDNFGITIGRLPTINGHIDTGYGLDKRIPYDYQKLVDNGDAFTSESYQNYMFKGIVSSIDPTTPGILFRDFSKHFKSEHKLLGSTTGIDFTASGNSDLIFNVKTGNCRVVFTSATNVANVGLVRTIVSHTTDQITLDVDLPAAISVGDEYVIIPDNALENKRSLYDLADAQNTILGSEANPLQLVFVQSWDEDISSNEDSNIEHAPIGQETTHRTQLRWCVRVVDIFSTGIERFASHYDLAQWGNVAGMTDPGNFKVYQGAESIKQSLFELIDTQEVAISKGAIGNIDGNGYNIFTEDGGATFAFKDKELVRSSGIVGYSYLDPSNQEGMAHHLLEITSDLTLNNVSNPALQGTQLITQSIMKGLGDKGFLDWPTLKAFILTHLFTDRININGSVDVSVLAMWSSPSKRLKIDWLNTGCDFSQANALAPLGVNNETLSDKLWFNSYFTDQNNLADSIVIPMHGGVPNDVNGTHGSQVSVFMTPPRTFLRNSEVATEIARARDCYYGNNSLEMIEPLRAIYSPTDFVRKIVSELRYDWFQDSVVQSDTSYGSLNQRIDLLENMIRFITGLNTNQNLRSVYGSFGKEDINKLPSVGNKLIKDDHNFGIGQAGTGSARTLLSDLDEDITNHLSGITQYEDGTVQVGGINYINPLRYKSSEKSIAGRDQIVDLGASSSPSMKTRERIKDGSGGYRVESTDTDYGFSETKGLKSKRELHEGLDSAMTFVQAFNFRKLAIKTSAHTQGDLFTINVPYWWEMKDEQVLFEQLKAGMIEDPDNAGEYLLPDSFFRTWFESFNGAEGTALSSYFSAIRSHLADVNSTGPMGLTSYNGIGLTPMAEALLPNSLGKDTGTTATNQDLLPFLNQHSGSIVASRFDQDSADLDNTSVKTYAQSLESAVASKLIDPNKNIWGRRSIGLEALKVFANRTSFRDNDGTSIDALPSTGLDANRCTSLRLRYHVGDCYPGEVDSRGVPANLLVDSLNLYVRVEPLPLVHWQTMPKHQHSILEGSMDMSEAIATLMDLANGRGIPDHLFTLADSFTPVNADNESMFLTDNPSQDRSDNSVLSIRGMITGTSGTNQISYFDGYLDNNEAAKNLYEGPFNRGLTAIGIPMIVPFTDARATSRIGNSSYALTTVDGGIRIEAFNPTNGPLDSATDYPKFIAPEDLQALVLDEIAGNQVATSMSLRFTQNTAWRESYDLWASSTGNPDSSQNNAFADFLALWLGSAILGIALSQISALEGSRTIHSSSGLLNLTATEAKDLFITNKTNLTLPVISTWLMNAYGPEGYDNQATGLRYQALNEIHPALRATKIPTVNSSGAVAFGNGFTAKSMLSKLTASAKRELINDIKQESGSTLKDAILEAYTGFTYSAKPGSIDPVGVCIPNSAQPYVHWYHPNMKALTAPGGTDGLKVQSTGLDPESQLQTADWEDIRYTPYGEWGSDSLIMTGIVPFGAQAERFRLSQGYKAIAGYNVSSESAGLVNAGLFNTSENENDIVRDDIFAFLKSGSLSLGPSIVAENLYRAIFNFDGSAGTLNLDNTRDNPTQLGDENPWLPAWNANWLDETGTQQVNQPTDDSLYPTMLPYFSYSTGLLGLGGIHNNASSESPKPTYSGENVDEIITNRQTQGNYDIWANWFPYMPSALHQNADSFHFSDQTAVSLKERFNFLVFSQQTGPVYLPASRVVYNTTLNPTDVNGTTTPLDQLAQSGGRQLNAEVAAGEYIHERNVGYHPMLQGIRETGAGITEATTGERKRELLAYPASDKSSQAIDAMISLLTSNSIDNTLLDNPDYLPSIEDLSPAFDGAVLRSGLSTETLGWINLYVKTYNQVYGHKSIHPYAYLSDPSQKPLWHKDFVHSKGIVSGKGPDKDVDTLYAGDVGTGLYMTKRSTFMDPLCLGVGAVRSTGQLTHDSANDEQDTFVFRDIFDLCSFEREVALSRMTSQTSVTKQNNLGSLIKTSAAWSKMGMQSKLMFNSSIRVLHTRPGGANSTFATNSNAVSKGEINYGATGQMPKSLTEMFLCVDPKTNKLHKAPRDSIFSATHKPYIHLESLISDVENTHPNYKVMKRLKPMISSNLTGSATNTSRLYLDSVKDTLGKVNTFSNNEITSQDMTIDSLLQGSKDVSIDTSRNNRTDAQINEHRAIEMGDAFAVDPFDVLWENTLPQGSLADTDRLSAIANTAENSGVEYELLSSLSRIHAKATEMRLTNNFNGNAVGLIDTMPTANELTLPGDHEIVFVLYTGDYGNSMVADTPKGVNPPVAGCHIKASIEINRPSERYDSQLYSEMPDSNNGIHYGIELIENLPHGITDNSINGDRNSTGLMTYSVAGGRPSLDLTVHNNDE